MKAIQSLCIAPTASVRHALDVIDKGEQLALVVDPGGHLLGTVTDGDVRRALLRGIGLEAPVSGVMNSHPHVLREGQSRADGLALMRRLDLRHVPVIGQDGRLVSLQTLKEILEASVRDNWVVLMAGGLGSRLYPLTREVPKPLIQVGTRPILQIIVEHLASHGFRKVFIAVNYKAELIEAFFGNGERFGVDIVYLRESERLGTAGALSLLPDRPTKGLLAMNGDLLTRMDFGSFMDAHQSSGAAATMALTTYVNQCPYGVVTLDGGMIVRLEEKPMQQYLVNAGIYALEPEALTHIPQGTAVDMPQLFERLIAGGLRVVGHPTADYWMDVGRIGDLEKARNEFGDG